MKKVIQGIDKIWFILLLFLLFYSPLIMFRNNGHILIKEIAPEIITLPHRVPKWTNLVLKEIFCQSIILILFYLTLIKKALTGNWKFSRSRLDIPILSFLAIAAISLTFSKTRYISFTDWGLLASFILFYYLILDQLNDIKKIRILLWSVIASAIVTAFFATCQHLQIYLWDFLVRADDRNRMSATIGHNNGVASYLMMSSFVLIALYFTKPIKEFRFQDTGKKLVWNLIQIILLIWFLFVILATLSRGVWIGTTAGMLILLYYVTGQYGWQSFIKKHWIKFAFGLFLFAIFIAVLSIPSRLNPLGVSVIKRFSDTVLRRETYFQDDRLRMWASSFEMIRDQPITGVGLGSFKYWIPIYQGKYFDRYPDSRLEPTYKLTNQSHNEYIQSWAELGIFGFLVGIWLLGKYISNGIKTLQNQSLTQVNNENYSENKASPIYFVSIFAGTIGVLIQSMVDFPLHVAPLALLFIFLGTLVVKKEKLNSETGFNTSFMESNHDRPIQVRDYLWISIFLIGCFVTLVPFGFELRADLLKNRMDYFLQAAEDFKGQGHPELQNRALKKAIEYGNRSLSLDSRNPRTHYELGLGYLKDNRIRQSIDHFLLALRDMQYAELHFNLADAYEWMRRQYASLGDTHKEKLSMENAIIHYRWAAFIYPLNKKLAEETHSKNLFYMPSEALHREGVLLYQQGKLNEAIKIWGTIARKDPYYLDDKFYKVAKEYRRVGDFEMALRILDQAYSLDTTNPMTWYKMGVMNFEAGNYKDVFQYLDKLYKVYPTDTTVVFGYAQSYEKLNNKEKALEWTDKTLSLDSTFEDALELLDRLHKTR